MSSTYRFVKACPNPSVIFNDIPSVLNIPTPDSIDKETLTYYHQSISNPNAIIFTFPSALSGPEEADLNSYMSSFVGVNNDDDKADMATAYLDAGFQIIQALQAKALIDGKSDATTNTWFSQIESVVNALNAGFLSVALDRLTSITAIIINILTGTMTTGEVTALRNLLQKLLGKTLT